MYETGLHRQISHQAFFVILNLLDYLTTHTLISTDGQELMPVGSAVIENYGLIGLLVFKLSLTSLVILLGKTFSFKDSLWELLNGFLTAVVVWNSTGIFLSMFFPV
jgi:hypothetical protein